MRSQTHIAAPDVAPFWGDPHPLLEQLGVPEDLAAPALASTALRLRQVNSLAALESFLHFYVAELLVPLELPVTLQAHRHAERNEWRELLALDRQLASEPKLREFAAASCRVGQRQLNRLRALRDVRLVQRYLRAVHAGQARAWHTLVYGVSLAVFSLPLRQGLVNYAHHTLGGFIGSAARPLAMAERQCRALHAQACANVPTVVGTLLGANGQPILKVV